MTENRSAWILKIYQTRKTWNRIFWTLGIDTKRFINGVREAKRKHAQNSKAHTSIPTLARQVPYSRAAARTKLIYTETRVHKDTTSLCYSPLLTFQTSLLFGVHGPGQHSPTEKRGMGKRASERERSREWKSLGRLEIRPDLIGIKGVTNVRVSATDARPKRIKIKNKLSTGNTWANFPFFPSFFFFPNCDVCTRG